MKVLIVGAGGFIGGFIARESLSRGYETWCAVRESTSRRYLTDPALNFITLDYDDTDKLRAALEGKKWDYIVYNLGATKCVNFSDFNHINFTYLRNFCEALIANDQVPERFLYISSLSAIGPGDEKTYAPLNGSMIPNPNTRYGVSKIKAETFLQTLPATFPWIILRPTGVYGPHEQDYLMMIKSIDSHFDFGVGFRRQMLTFIYVEDLARAIFDALEKAPVHHKYIISEPRAYSQAEFRRIVAKELGRSLVIPVRLPLWALKIACVVSEKYGAAKLQAVTLNTDKYKIMAQRNWNCDITDAERDFGFRPQINLEEGIRRTVRAYRNELKNKD
ncbi:MAG: NAD(P)-dependent oxidoreductase [Bacteroides sp.]|nr:NAD(P)-dependent oxidoreductase [Bacteroides sp.]MBD5318738.1 NAD(P)-dependent oxidoreductase [Bacteroides sp.]MDE6813187.1 NAD(P)-dependent oxidoreductase [Duncaniella sp.]